MIIVGAGLSGLIAANMLRKYKPVVYESQPTLPSNHEALLRFRSDAVSRATGIPFTKVEVTKGISYRGQIYTTPNPFFNNLYSYKVSGEYGPRSIADLSPVTRYIAPKNFTEVMARSCDIRFNYGQIIQDLVDSGQYGEEFPPLISTIPMPVLMGITGYDRKLPVVFDFKAIWSVRVDVEQPKTNLYQTLYYPDPAVPYYRATLSRNRLIVEFSNSPSTAEINKHLAAVLLSFGLVGVSELSEYLIKEQKYGKILPIEERARTKFILAATDEYRIYSLGRFATWRQILLDDVVQDVNRIERWIIDRDAYGRRAES